jgi:hypothetical protein
LSYINRKLARKSGTNLTTQAGISNRFWFSFAGRVKPGRSCHESLSLVFSASGTSYSNRGDLSPELGLRSLTEV